MSEINPYESPQSEASAPTMAEAAPPYPAWNTRAINAQMLAIVLAVVCLFCAEVPSLGTVCVWLAIGLGVLIEVLAVVLTWTAIRYRVTWLLVSELSLLLPVAIVLVARLINHGFPI